MSQENGRSGTLELERLNKLLDTCMARDVPGLLKRMRALRRRCQQGLAVDRGLVSLRREIGQSCDRVELRRRSMPQPDYPLDLPVVERRRHILEVVNAHQVVVLCGETGSGKTTQLPKICLELGRGARGRIGHTQPRRIAARSVAARIAEELNGPLGQYVGFKVRFHDQVQDNTYIKVMTDGILLAEIQSDPQLREYDTLIVDEAHERSLNIDFLLGYLHVLLPRRPDLKLIITSATINPERFSNHFGQAPIVEVSGRTYPVEIRYRPLRGEDDDQKDRDRDQAILDAVDELAADGPGDVLVFLPGERAIRETSERLRKHHPPQTDILPLYARLSTAQQNQVFQTHKQRRIVLATNVAETSLTVPGIRYVVDVGLARISRYSYRTKVQRLPIEAISQASAKQRAGRCGRVAAGICIRLYDEDDYQGRAEFTQPEILRTNLASVILQMVALGLGRVEDFPFIDPPDARLIRDGYKLLYELGAVDERYQLTGLGRQISRLPVDPRLSRMILAAKERRCLNEVLIIVAALEVADPRERPLDQAQTADKKHALFQDPKSDFLAYLHLWTQYHEQARHLSRNKLRKWCGEHFLSYMRMREWVEVERQLRSLVKGVGMNCNQEAADYRSLHCALLTGLLGNLAYQSEPDEYLGARNVKFALFPGSGLVKKKPKWLVASELVETGKRYLRTAAAIDPAWVEPLAQHLAKRNYSQVHWEMKRAQVMAYEQVTLYGLPLVTQRKVNFAPIDAKVARELFIRHALVRGEFRTKAAFARHNFELLEQLNQLESKSRRRDVLVEEEELYRFFNERIPASVCDGLAFERWWKKESTRKPSLLNLRREDVMQHTAQWVTGERFPDSLTVRGLVLPVRYHFAPDEDNDGVNVQIPIAALNQLNASDFDWLVPGLLEEKITLLIKSLPKQLRRHFVPVPHFANACLQSLTQRQGSLIERVGEELQRMTGVSIAANAWRPKLLPAHLFAYFELVDGQGRCLDRGRDLEQLQRRYAQHARQGFAGATDTGFERRDVSEWDFGVLPEYQEIKKGTMILRGYPALAVTDRGIELRLFERQQEALKSHQEGLLALFRRKAGRSVKEIGRAVPNLQQQVLWFSTLAGGDVLRADLERAVMQVAFLGDGKIIRDAETFEQRLQDGRRRLVEQATLIGQWSFEALQAFYELNRKLKKALSPEMIAAVREVRQQAGRLVYPGFVSRTPLHWLPHIGRFLRAALKRLEKLPENPARDRKQAAVVQRFWERYEQASAGGAKSAALEEFRWQIEELRVSMFAQTLGTSVKVSPERLERLWAEEVGKQTG